MSMHVENVWLAGLRTEQVVYRTIRASFKAVGNNLQIRWACFEAIEPALKPSNGFKLSRFEVGPQHIIFIYSKENAWQVNKNIPLSTILVLIKVCLFSTMFMHDLYAA